MTSNFLHQRSKFRVTLSACHNFILIGCIKKNKLPVILFALLSVGSIKTYSQRRGHDSMGTRAHIWMNEALPSQVTCPGLRYSTRQLQVVRFLRGKIPCLLKTVVILWWEIPCDLFLYPISINRVATVCQALCYVIREIKINLICKNNHNAVYKVIMGAVKGVHNALAVKSRHFFLTGQVSVNSLGTVEFEQVL